MLKSKPLCEMLGCMFVSKRYGLCVKCLILARDGDPKELGIQQRRLILTRGLALEKAEKKQTGSETMPTGKKAGSSTDKAVCATPGCGHDADGTRGQCKHCSWYRLHGADADKRAQVMSHALAPKRGAPGTASGRSVRGKSEASPAKRTTPPAAPQETALVEQAARLQDGMQQFADLLGLQQMPVAGGHVMHNPATAHIVYLTGDGMHRIDLPGQESAETDP